MKLERDNLAKIGAQKDLQYRQLQKELQELSINIEAKNRAIHDLEIRFGFVEPPK